MVVCCRSGNEGFSNKSCRCHGTIILKCTHSSCNSVRVPTKHLLTVGKKPRQIKKNDLLPQNAEA